MAGKLFLGGISPNTTTEAIEAHFARYGTVVDAVVMYKDGKHRGFGFVTFDNADSVGAVLAEDQVIDGRTIDAKPAVPQGEAPPARLPEPQPTSSASTPRPITDAPDQPTAGSSGPACDKVFVGGLAQTTTDEKVREYFSRYGTIIDCVVMKDRESNRSRGFGFVQFDCTPPVDQIMAEYHDHHIDGKWIEVKKAIPQDRMPAPQPGTTAMQSRAYGGYYGGYKGQPMWPGRSPYGAYGAYGPPAIYPGYMPHYGMAYSPYYPAYHLPSGAPPGRSSHRKGPY